MFVSKGRGEILKPNYFFISLILILKQSHDFNPDHLGWLRTLECAPEVSCLILSGVNLDELI